jgi:hypothetical protein
VVVLADVLRHVRSAAASFLPLADHLPQTLVALAFQLHEPSAPTLCDHVLIEKAVEDEVDVQAPVFVVLDHDRHRHIAEHPPHEATKFGDEIQDVIKLVVGRAVWPLDAITALWPLATPAANGQRAETIKTKGRAVTAEGDSSTTGGGFG